MVYMEKESVRVSEYERIMHVAIDEIRVNYKGCQIIISGNNLQLCMMSREELKIKGNIAAVSFYE